MTVWELWRQDDNGNRVRMGVFADRVEALAKILALESGVVHKQTYWVDGPPGPVCRTNRDLYRRLVSEGERMNAATRSLDVFLRAWWRVARPLSDRVSLDLDTVAAMVAAAGMVEPAPLQASWRSASFRYTDEPTSYADWEAIVLSQIADLADFADQGPLDEYARFGMDTPGRQHVCEPRTSAGTTLTRSPTWNAGWPEHSAAGAKTTASENRFLAPLWR
ncbi:hypothetical protein GA0074692_1027 [Micromonospora pallida]|uniref:Uncharacterized protein n=1 Tax=Micromonospora pallida TaxID=145854 RepID=A0A1C6RUM5_9ACTN|nr:hypothetical protein [Micromonospora pallida]SCL20918.1 hypothetical protein GA0074692_1027 [Micromonospora pallida]